MEPGNMEYQELLNYLESGRSTYQRTTMNYAPAGNIGSICCTLFALRLCCCPF